MNNKRILVVDDDRGTTLAFKLGLENFGFLVDTYNDPLTALENYKPDFYNLLLVDIRMPSLNGFEFCKEIEKIDKSPKICFMTSFKAYYDSLMTDYPDVKQRCFIQKPISIKDLMEKISSEIA